MKHSRTLVLLLATAATAVGGPGPAPHQVRLDQDGDPLPDGAVARLGSTRFRLPRPQPLAYAPEPDTALALGPDGVTAWDLRTGAVRRAWRLARVTDVVPSPDGRWAAFREGRTSWLWNVRESRRQVRLAGPGVGTIGAIAFAPDGRHLATVDESEGAYGIRVWDLDTGRMRLLGARETPDGGLWFVDGGRRLLSHPSERHDVTCWDVGTGRRAWQLDLRGRIVACADGPHFIVESPHRGFTLHAAADGKPVPCRGLAGLEPGWHQVLARSADGSRIVWSDRREDCLFVGRVAPDEQEWKPVRIAAAPGDRPTAALSADGRRLLVAHPRLTEFDTETGRRLTPDPPESARPDRLDDPVWTRDGRRVLTRPVGLSADGRTGLARDRILWAADTGRFLGRVSAAEVNRHHPAGHRPFLRAPEEALADWSFADPPPGAESPSLAGGVLLSPDRRFGLRVGPRHKSDLPWRPVESVFERATLRPVGLPSLGLTSNLAFSPDGRTLATVQPDGVQLWDFWTARPLRAFLRAPPTESGDQVPLASELAFSPDGRRLATCGPDGTILIWDTARPPAAPAPLREADLDRLWGQLAAPDPAVAWAAAARLADRPGESVPYLARRLTPVRALTEAETNQLLADLDAPAYRTRERAMKRAAELGDAAGVVVEAALKEKTGAEVRQRLEILAAALDWRHPPAADDLRRLRALAVLEQIGTKEARAKVDELAGGLAAGRVRLEAKSVRQRLTERGQADRD